MRNLIQFIKSNTLAVLVTIAVILYFVSKLLQTPPPAQESEQEVRNAWRSIIPGESTQSDVLDQLGEPVETEDQGEETMLSYDSANPNFDHQVTIDKATNEVSFIKEIVPKESGRTTQDLVRQFGPPEESLYYPGDSSPSFLLYVYPSVGIAYSGHIQSGQLLEIWHFTPTTLENFIDQYAQGYRIYTSQS